MQTSNGMIQALFIMMPGIDSIVLAHWKGVLIILISLSIIFIILAAFFKTVF